MLPRLLDDRPDGGRRGQQRGSRDDDGKPGAKHEATGRRGSQSSPVTTAPSTTGMTICMASTIGPTRVAGARCNADISLRVAVTPRRGRGDHQADHRRPALVAERVGDELRREAAKLSAAPVARITRRTVRRRST